MNKKNPLRTFNNNRDKRNQKVTSSWPDYSNINKNLEAAKNDLAKYSFIGKSRLDMAVRDGDKKRFISLVDNSHGKKFNRTDTGDKTQGEVMWDNRESLSKGSIPWEQTEYHASDRAKREKNK